MEKRTITVLLASLVFAALSYLLTYAFGFLIRDGLPGLNWKYDIAVKDKRVFTYDPPENIGNSLLMLNNFDSNFYLGIATRGYEKQPFSVDTGLKRWAFYPMYPASVSVVSKLLGVSSEIGIFKVGLVVSNLCLFLFAAVLFFLLIELGYSFKDWIYALLFILVFPTSYFLNIFYTESMFLFFSVSALLLILRKKYFLSSILVFFASITRSVGILLFVPMLVVLITDGRLKVYSKVWRTFIYGLFSVSGILLFFTYLYLITGDFFSSVKIQSAWGRGDMGSSLFPFRSIFLSMDRLSFGNASDLIGKIDLVFSLLGVTSLIFVLSQVKNDTKKLALGVYFLVYFAFVTSTSVNSSIIRYLMSAIPIYLAAIELRRKSEVLFTALICIFALLHTLFFVFFVLHVPSSGV